MKITICGSIAFYERMQSMRDELMNLGHEVKLPPHEIKDEDGRIIPIQAYYERRKSETSDASWIWNRKAEAIMDHFEKVAWSDAILVLNYDKNDIRHYIGGNTLLEMGVAFYLKKKIYLLNPIPEISYKEEILGMKPIIVNNSLLTLSR